MSDWPLVSIVTPSYNQAEYLEATIQSVLAQDYPNLEYMVVDGGSQDGSLEIIQRYTGQLAWWVSEPDQGQADAINKGLRRAKGEVIAWLNSDDVYLPGVVRQAVETLRAHSEAGLVYGDLQSINAQGEHFNTIRYQPYDLLDMLSFRIIGQPAVFMRRSVQEKAGYLDLSYRYLLDHHLWVRMAAQAEMIYVPQEWAAARHHPTAKNVAEAGGFGREAYRILEWAGAQPDMAAMIASNQRRVWAGAYRLDARYLLEGGAARQSLKAYWRAFRNQPGYALSHWHRILFAFLSLLGFRRLRRFIQKY
jgi:glycosyltransferase involved in cell wall biosynthesis